VSEAKKVVEALVAGGQATAGPPLGPALGPLGVNVLAIVNKINEVTKDYAGMKVPVKVTVDTETKEFEVTVGTPTTSALIVSELKIAELLSPNLKAAVKEVLGSCVSMGVTVDGKDPRDVQKEVNEGKHESVLGKEE